jgi:hypothetical protein
MVGSDDDDFYGGEDGEDGEDGPNGEFKAKRVLANRQSAQRSRQRKLHFIASLDASATGLAVEIESLGPALAGVRRDAAATVADHARLSAAVDAGLALAAAKDAGVAAAVAAAGGLAAAAGLAGGPPPVLGALPPMPPPPPAPEVVALPPPPPPAAYSLARPATARPATAGLPPRPTTAAPARRTPVVVVVTPSRLPTSPDPTSPTALGAAFRAGGGGSLTPVDAHHHHHHLHQATSPLPRSLSPLDFADVVPVGVATTPAHGHGRGGSAGPATTPCGVAAGGVSPFAFGGDANLMEPMSPVDFGAEAF